MLGGDESSSGAGHHAVQNTPVVNPHANQEIHYRTAIGADIDSWRITPEAFAHGQYVLEDHAEQRSYVNTGGTLVFHAGKRLGLQANFEFHLTSPQRFGGWRGSFGAKLGIQARLFMHGELKNAFESYLNDARNLLITGNIEAAVENLERAHVLGQRFVLPHMRCHMLFLQVGWARRSLRELWGQSIRLVLGIIGSAVGLVPIGNTGGANVGMFRTMPIDPQLSRLSPIEPVPIRNGIG